MKNHFIIVFLAFSLLSGMNATAAVVTVNDWQCSSRGDSGSEATCYVTNVRFKPGTDPYVMAKLHNPKSDTDCERIWVRVDKTANSVEEVRAVEALLLVALTTGLPVKFYVKSRDGNLCFVSSVIVSKPGH